MPVAWLQASTMQAMMKGTTYLYCRREEMKSPIPVVPFVWRRPRPFPKSPASSPLRCVTDAGCSPPPPRGCAGTASEGFLEEQGTDGVKQAGDGCRQEHVAPGRAVGVEDFRRVAGCLLNRRVMPRRKDKTDQQCRQQADGHQELEDRSAASAIAAGSDSAMYRGTTTQRTPPARPISRRASTSE